MSTEVERQAADRTAPLAIYARTTVMNDEVIEIPSTFNKKFITFQAEASAVKLAFGTSVAVAADPAARSVLTGNLPAAAVSGCLDVPANSERTYRIPSNCTHFAHISADTSGVLRFFNSTGPGE